MLLQAPNLTEAILLAFAIWRVTVMLIYEVGPFSLFRRLRELIGFQYSDEGELISFPETFPASAFICPWCLSFWVAIPILAVFYLHHLPVTFLGIWGIASSLASVNVRLTGD